MFYTISDLMVYIILDTNIYIDLWLDTQLVNDIILKRIEGDLMVIDCEKLLCNFFPFCINIFP
jgi:hypothetical protein